jgi:pimeloyl-ACP methyl ester carboxylesterase
VGDGPSTWRRQIESLADEFTVVAWCAPGVDGSSDPPEGFGMAGYADCLAGFVDGLRLDKPHVAGLSFGGALALALYRRHPSIPTTLILASAYAGWGGSLPADVAEQRLQQALSLASLSPDEFVGTLLPTMFSEGTPQGSVDEFGASMRGFHPVGFRAMARASAEDLRDVLPDINVPTLLVYGDTDVRAPLTVAEHLHAAITGSTLVVLPTSDISATSKPRTRSTGRSGPSYATERPDQQSATRAAGPVVDRACELGCGVRVGGQEMALRTRFSGRVSDVYVAWPQLHVQRPTAPVSRRPLWLIVGANPVQLLSRLAVVG